MSVAQFLESAKAFAAGNLPIVVGGAVAILVLGYLFLTNRRRRSLADIAGNPAVTAAEEKALNWAPPEQSYADRRESVRRDGQPIRVILSSTSFRNGVNDGFVIDRSTGGLKIVTRTAMAPGGTVQVRAANAPDTVGFVTAIVRSCRPEGDHFVVGCEFEKTPPWNVLLLFG
jgi:PilZ domain